MHSQRFRHTNPLGSVPDALDQTPEFDAADSEPVPDDDFDESGTTASSRRSGKPADLVAGLTADGVIAEHGGGGE